MEDQNYISLHRKSPLYKHKLICKSKCTVDFKDSINKKHTYTHAIIIFSKLSRKKTQHIPT